MQLVTLPVKRIVPSPDNPRTVNEKRDDFLELVKSIQARGVIVPVHVRVHPKRKDKYELLAGERRWRACQAAKVNEILAIDHGPLSDSEAFEITFAENFCREDLSVLEEGKAASVLLDRYRGDAKAVAAKLGRTERWVHLRAGIHQNLCESWRRKADEERFKDWTAAHLALIARFPANVQEALLKKINKGWVWTRCQDWTVAELDKHCTEELMLLTKAPFDTGRDSKCAKCPKRSSVQPTLWAEKKADAIDANDRCLDRKCWDKREASACKRLVAKTKTKYEGLVCVSNASSYNVDSTKLKRCYGKYLNPGDFAICKKADKGATPALVIAGKDKGKVRYVRVNPTRPLMSTRSRKPSAAELKAQAERERWAETAARFCERLEKVPYAEIPGSKASAIGLVAIFVGSSQLYLPQDCAKFRKALEEANKKGPANTLDCILERLWLRILDDLDFDGLSGDSQEDRAVMGVVATAFGMDLTAIYNEVVAEEKATDSNTSDKKGKDAKHTSTQHAA
jgi:ParB/RepB/Spo0J family partition protein